MKGFERPEMKILSESAEIPEGHVVQRPEEFTHEVVRDQPYWYDVPTAEAPDRVLRAGTKVRLVADEGASSHVVDPRGLLVMIDKSALRKL